MTRVEVPHDPTYHFTTDMATQAIAWTRYQQALTPDKPFFMYFATGATHAPHHAPKEWIAKYKGKFDQGWDRLREETLARQIQLGVVPAGTKLTPRPAEIPAWDSLTADQKRLFARQMETFAGFGEHTDYEIGRLVQTIQDMGELENTLFLYIVGDNGASAEGGPDGSYNELLALNGIVRRVVAAAAHRCVGRPEYVPALLHRLGARRQYTLPVDQASRVALRRHTQSDGHALAQSHHSQR